jgi:hypothetical protein
MKKNWMLFLFFAASAALTFSGCSDDDNSDVPENTHLVSKEVQAAFNAKYPQAKDVEWELKGDYAVVDLIGMVGSILHGSIRYRLPGI